MSQRCFRDMLASEGGKDPEEAGFTEARTGSWISMPCLCNRSAAAKGGTMNACRSQDAPPISRSACSAAASVAIAAMGKWMSARAKLACLRVQERLQEGTDRRRGLSRKRATACRLEKLPSEDWLLQNSQDPLAAANEISAEQAGWPSSIRLKENRDIRLLEEHLLRCVLCPSSRQAASSKRRLPIGHQASPSAFCCSIFSALAIRAPLPRSWRSRRHLSRSSPRRPSWRIRD